jgi:ElaA protein
MTKKSYQWELKPFQDLKNEDLYLLLQLRVEVFIIEQNCIFQDLDGKDKACHHLLGWDGSTLVAGARIVPQGVSYPDYPSIGRVVNRQTYRGKGAGKELMQEAIAHCIALYGDTGIKIGAQYYLKGFYESLGFVAKGEIYDEDGIDHIKMIRPAGL